MPNQSPPYIYLQSERNNSTVTPGLDNFSSSSIGGGISGLALGVANGNNRQSGIDAMEHDGYTGPTERAYNTTGAENPYVPPPVYESSQYGSNMALGAAAAAPGGLTPGHSSSHLSDVSRSPNHSYGGVPDGPYQRQSQYNGDMDIINPEEIVDDEDEFSSGHKAAQAGGAAAGGAAAGGFFSKLFGRGNKTAPSYGPVPGAGLERGGRSEKAATGMAARKKRALIVGGVMGFVILGAIVGGAVGGTLGNRHSNKDGSSSSDSSSGSNSDDDSTDLGKDSSEIKALMNNTNLHKVFPGIDYTPWGVQYPLCLKYPPSQNNVTRDMAVLSQLTNTVRLYGTDCNQTEMTLHAIDRLGLTDMKLWLGVWIDSNTTTTDRQLNQLYHILDNSNTSIYKGVIVGNEALYRAGSTKASAETNLINYLNDVRAQLKKRSLTDMLVATSDLGDNWNAKLTTAVDVVMSNVHPFFAGVSVEVAAGWTWDFWQWHDVILTKGTTKKQVISEVGWPSAGGKDCGGSSVCDSSTPGSVASITNQNQFMADWICQALENGTEYFWFEAFDEPWKVEYNTPDKAWEDKWGLMDPGRVLKKGLTIPDCGGKTAT